MSECPCVWPSPDTGPCLVCGTPLSEPCPYAEPREGVTDGREPPPGPDIAGEGAGPPETPEIEYEWVDRFGTHYQAAARGPDGSISK